MTTRTYVSEQDDINLFRTRSGKAVHIQRGIVYRDLLDEEVSQEDRDEANESMIGWVMYERRLAICGVYSTNGIFDCDRGVTGWCKDEELCVKCMSALDDDQRCLIFQYLTDNEEPRDSLDARWSPV